MKEKEIKKLIEQLRYPSKREQAIKELVNIGKPAIPFLIRALGDPQSSVRYPAAEALGELKAEEAIPELKRLLLTDSENLSLEAAESLGKILGLEAVSIFYSAADKRPELMEHLFELIETASRARRSTGSKRNEVRPQLGPVAHLFHPQALDVKSAGNAPQMRRLAAR